MGVVLPNELAFVLDLIGISWPNVDEDDYREMATFSREFADDCDHGGTGLGGSVANLLGATEGPAIEAFNSHWAKVSSHLGNLGEAARLGATASRSDMDTQVTEAYTERAPCRTHRYHCGEWLQKYYPQTDVPHSFEYGENPTGNDAEELKKAREASQARGNKALDTYTTSLGRTFRR